MITRTYGELQRLDTFEERYEYLRLKGAVGEATFGFDRWINQGFYKSAQWKRIRQDVIARDYGCDLGIEGRDIFKPDVIIIHHMNPMTPEAIEAGDTDILDPRFLISVTHDTHNAIHYGNAKLLREEWTERKPGDTKLW